MPCMGDAHVYANHEDAMTRTRARRVCVRVIYQYTVGGETRVV